MSEAKRKRVCGISLTSSFLADGHAETEDTASLVSSNSRTSARVSVASSLTCTHSCLRQRRRRKLARGDEGVPTATVAEQRAARAQARLAAAAAAAKARAQKSPKGT